MEPKEKTRGHVLTSAGRPRPARRSSGPPFSPEVPGADPVPMYHGRGTGQQDLMVER